MVITIAGEDYEIVYTEHAEVIERAIQQDRPRWITFDSETTGLHLKKDRPFLWAIAWDGKVFVFPSKPEILRWVAKWATLVEYVYAHNTVFDMNMMANATDDQTVLSIKNWGDTMGLCRLVFEAISSREGGDSLKLKELGRKYIDPNAQKWETEVHLWLSGKKAQNKKVLIAMLKGVGWTFKRWDAAYKHQEEPIPPEVQEVYDTWRECYPDPTYQDVPIEIMLPYVAVDVILTNKLVHKAISVVEYKQQMQILQEEFALIPVVFKMGRIGIRVDREYLTNCRDKLTAYIEELNRKKIELNNGVDFNVNSHKSVKEIYYEVLGEMPESVDKKFMAKMKNAGDELAIIITKLRTLEKWRSTYIDRIMNGSAYDGRFYATLDQFNPVSGRFSGNLQQQPKKAIYHHETNEELFHPRKAFLADTDENFKIFLLDFSQVELRFQAHYTLPFGGDLNLCRAYMPFKCKHYITGELYEFTSEESKSRWQEKRENGESAWVIPETGEPWQPTDVHSASTRKALGLMGIDADSLTEKEFQTWRGLGKGVNFAKNYGVGIKGAADQFGLELEVAKALCEGYNAAFPTVITYQNNVVSALSKRGFVTGIYGRRYYLSDSWRFYKAANYLIQGSCAHDLKLKMLILDELLEGKKSAMLTCIHDEIIYRIHEDELNLIPEIKSIMEYTPKIQVPIVSEVDYTESTWADKHRWKG